MRDTGLFSWPRSSNEAMACYLTLTLIVHCPIGYVKAADRCLSIQESKQKMMWYRFVTDAIRC